MPHSSAIPAKAMSVCEGATALAFAALAFVSLMIAAMAHTPEYAFHAYLFSAGSVAAVIGACIVSGSTLARMLRTMVYTGLCSFDT